MSVPHLFHVTANPPPKQKINLNVPLNQCVMLQTSPQNSVFTSERHWESPGQSRDDAKVDVAIAMPKKNKWGQYPIAQA